MINKILIAVDGSEFSARALDFACQMAARFDSALHILHVPQGAAADRVMVLGGASVMIHASHAEIEKAGRKLIDSALECAEETVGGNITTELRGGDPAHEILASAEENEVDCIVLGSRGLGDFGSLVLGSVSHKVNHSAPCTCITVH